MSRNSKIKMLFPTGSFYPAQTGGPDNSVYWLTKALMKKGVEVQVVSTDRGLSQAVPRRKWLERDFAKIIYTKNWMHYLPLALLFTAWKQLKTVDVLHLTMIFYPASFLMALLNQLFYQKPIVWSVRGDLDPHMMQRSSWKKRPIIFLIKYFLRKSSTFHTTCDAETQYAKATFGQDIKVVQLTNYMELPKPIALPKENYLLYLGRIDSKKAIENLIAALHESKHFRTSDFTLQIAGDHKNTYGEQLLALVKDLNLETKVEFLGHVAGEAKQELLAAAYFLIMPSHTENFGIVVAEALAQNTPAVASIHTPWKVLEEEQAGFWVDNSIRSLADCVDTILQLHPEEYNALQASTRSLAVREFDIHANSNKWVDVYENLLLETKATSIITTYERSI